MSICQNNKFTFSFLQNTYLGLAQAITSTISTLGFWYIQRYWKIRTKPMVSRSLAFQFVYVLIITIKFVITNVVTILIPLWGMIGIWTQKFGFHNVWEFWCELDTGSGYTLDLDLLTRSFCRAYNVVFGLFQAPYYAFSQTMMAELAPPGFDNMVTSIINMSIRVLRTYPFFPKYFGLFGLSNRASSMIGPNVIQAIIDRTGVSRSRSTHSSHDLTGVC